MSARIPVDMQQKMKNFFGSTANMNANQQTYVTYNLAHKMNYTELGRFSRLDEGKGIDSFLMRFEKPLSKVVRGTGGNPDVVRIQTVCLDPTVQQDIRLVHLMYHFYVRAGHE